MLMSLGSYVIAKVLYRLAPIILVVRKFEVSEQDDRLAVRILQTAHLYGRPVWIKDQAQEFTLENVELRSLPKCRSAGRPSSSDKVSSERKENTAFCGSAANYRHSQHWPVNFGHSENGFGLKPTDRTSVNYSISEVSTVSLPA